MVLSVAKYEWQSDFGYLAQLRDKYQTSENINTYKGSEIYLKIHYPKFLENKDIASISIHENNMGTSNLDDPTMPSYWELSTLEKDIHYNRLEKITFPPWSHYREIIENKDGLKMLRSITLARFDIYDTVYEENLDFFVDWKWVNIKINFNMDQIKSDYPQYFTKNNFSDSPFWKDKDKFVQDILHDKIIVNGISSNQLINEIVNSTQFEYRKVTNSIVNLTAFFAVVMYWVILITTYIKDNPFRRLVLMLFGIFIAVTTLTISPLNILSFLPQEFEELGLFSPILSLILFLIVFFSIFLLTYVKNFENTTLKATFFSSLIMFVVSVYLAEWSYIIFSFIVLVNAISPLTGKGKMRPNMVYYGQILAEGVLGFTLLTYIRGTLDMNLYVNIMNTFVSIYIATGVLLKCIIGFVFIRVSSEFDNKIEFMGGDVEETKPTKLELSVYIGIAIALTLALATKYIGLNTFIMIALIIISFLENQSMDRSIIKN